MPSFRQGQGARDPDRRQRGACSSRGTLSEYEITPDGGLRVRFHEREWHEDPDAFADGYLKSVNDRWEDIPDVHGDIRIYTLDSGERAEFRVRFTDGVVSQVKELDRAAP